MEHSAILELRPDRSLVTLLKDARLRWPDGFSFGPDGWLYVTCSALQHVLLRSSSDPRRTRRIRSSASSPAAAGVPGQ